MQSVIPESPTHYSEPEELVDFAAVHYRRYGRDTRFLCEHPMRVRSHQRDLPSNRRDNPSEIMTLSKVMRKENVANVSKGGNLATYATVTESVITSIHVCASESMEHILSVTSHQLWKNKTRSDVRLNHMPTNSTVTKPLP